MKNDTKIKLDFKNALDAIDKLFTEKTTGFITDEIKTKVLNTLKGLDMLESPTDIEIVFIVEKGLYEIILKV